MGLIGMSFLLFFGYCNPIKMCACFLQDELEKEMKILIKKGLVDY